MNSGPWTQEVTFTQGNQGAAEPDASHSALFYLFQEVSRLASPVHSPFLHTKSPSKWLSEASQQDRFLIEKEDDARLFPAYSCPGQRSVSAVLPYSQINKMKESHGGRATALVEPHPECNSPWRVLSLINLQCERLLHRSDVEESEHSSSNTKITDVSSTAVADVAEQGVGSGSVSVEYTLRPSLVIYKRQEITASVSHVDSVRGDHSGEASDYKPQCCVSECEALCSVQPQAAEETETGIPKLVEDNATASSQPQHGDQRQISFCVNRQLARDQGCEQDCFSPQQGFLNVAFSENALSQALIPSASPRTQLTYNSNKDINVALSKSALRVDHNANIVLTSESLCDTQLPPLSATLPPSPAASLLCSEIAPSSSQRWRTKTPRKQPHPSRSVDIRDPDFQGVTFRMGTELDDSREQCRLLITSKYSKELCKSTRRQRLRTRMSQKSLKTSSSDEESDPTTTVSKGKVCASCCTRTTPMWRDAEDGTPLCNACGIRYKKYRVRCVNCWHIPRKEGNSNSCCLKCGNLVRLTSAQRKHTT